VTSSGTSQRGQGPLPWLTYALAGLCFGWQVWADHAARDVKARSRAELGAAADYFMAHPYLAVPPEVEARLGAQGIETRRGLHEGAMRRRRAEPIPERVVAREQAELDQRVAAARAELEALPARRFGLRANAPAPIAFASHAIPHSGWLHLAGSLGMLLLLGRILEGALGPLAFGLVGLGSVVASGGAFALANRELAEPLIGSAGLVAGMIGALVAQGSDMLRRPARAAALALALAWLNVPHLLAADWSLAPPSQLGVGASNFALAGGLAFGCLAALGLRAAGREPGRAHGAACAAELVRPKLERALQARSEGHLDRAFALLGQLVREAPEDREVGLALWEVGRELGRNADAAAALVRVVRADLRRGDAGAAIRSWLDLRQAKIEAPPDPALRIRLAPLLAEAGHHEAAVEALRSALEGSERGDATAVSTRIARVARELDPAVAEQAAWRALGSLSLGLEERRSLEALLGQLYRTGAESPAASQPAPTEPAALELTRVVQADAQDSAPGEPAGRQEWVEPGLLADALRHGAGSDAPRARPAPASRALEVVEAVPIELTDEGLRLEIDGVGKKRLRYEAVGAIGVGAVRGLAAKAVILVDLVLNWRAGSRGPLRLVRLRSDRFDARGFFGPGPSSSEALRQLIGELLSRSGAVPLPDRSAAHGTPFTRYADLHAYERDVLRCGGDDAEDEPLLL
jgi:membrane associated rhomboid family serine protease